MGLMVAMLIGLWIYDELSFDTYHENYNDIVQVMQHQTVDGAVITEPAIPWPLETGLRNTYGADFKYIVLATWLNYHALSHGEEKITKLGIYAQPDLPEMISLHMIAGTRNGLRERELGSGFRVTATVESLIEARRCAQCADRGRSRNQTTEFASRRPLRVPAIMCSEIISGRSGWA